MSWRKVLAKITGAEFKPAQGAFYQAVKLPIKEAGRFCKIYD